MDFSLILKSGKTQLTKYLHFLKFCLKRDLKLLVATKTLIQESTKTFVKIILQVIAHFLPEQKNMFRTSVWLMSSVFIDL